MSLVTIKVDNKEIKVLSELIHVEKSPFTDETIPQMKDNIIEVEGNSDFYQLLVRYYKMLHEVGLKLIEEKESSSLKIGDYRIFERIEHFNHHEKDVFSDYLIPLNTIEDRIKLVDKLIPMIDFSRNFEVNLHKHLLVIMADHLLRPCSLREKDQVLWNWRNNKYEPSPYQYGKGPFLFKFKSEAEIDAKQEEANQYLKAVLETPIEERFIVQVKMN